MTTIILVFLVIALIFMLVLAWGLCKAASEEDERNEKENDDAL